MIKLIFDIQNIIGTKRVVYGVFLDDKAVYIGQTKNDVLTRIAQHLSKEETIIKYVRKHKIKKLKVEILYAYKNNHKDLKKLLDTKETEFMKKYKSMGYELINISKTKKL